MRTSALFAFLPFLVVVRGAILPVREVEVKVAPIPLQPEGDMPISIQAGATENELSGPCKAVTFIFARGTTEGKTQLS